MPLDLIQAYYADLLHQFTFSKIQIGPNPKISKHFTLQNRLKLICDLYIKLKCFP
jgi:hypothetical protein